jgi:hypothetical protein
MTLGETDMNGVSVRVFYCPQDDVRYPDTRRFVAEDIKQVQGVRAHLQQEGIFAPDEALQQPED